MLQGSFSHEWFFESCPYSGHGFGIKVSVRIQIWSTWTIWCGQNDREPQKTKYLGPNTRTDTLLRYQNLLLRNPLYHNFIISRYETPKNQVATPVHQEKRKHQAARSPKIESKDDQPIRENLEKNSVKNLSVKQIKEICDKNLQVCRVKHFYLLWFFILWDHCMRHAIEQITPFYALMIGYLLRRFPFKEFNIVKILLIHVIIYIWYM